MMQDQLRNLITKELINEGIIEQNNIFKARRFIRIVEEIAAATFKEIENKKIKTRRNIPKIYNLLDDKKVSEINVALSFFVNTTNEEKIKKVKKQIETYFEYIFQTNQIPTTEILEHSFLFRVL